LDVESDDNGITLRLHAKDGAEIDAREIQKCLDYTVAQVSKTGPADS
jgi:hypothetical protein